MLHLELESAEGVINYPVDNLTSMIASPFDGLIQLPFSIVR
jgi:hypothetical protein